MVYLCSRPLARSTSSRLVEHAYTPPSEGSNRPSRDREDSNKLPLLPSSPPPLVIRPIGDWRWSLPAVRAAFPISSSAPSRTPGRVMAPRLPPSPLCAESVAFAIDVEASAPQPGGTRWDGRVSIPCVAGVPASTTRTTVGEEASSQGLDALFDEHSPEHDDRVTPIVLCTGQSPRFSPSERHDMMRRVHRRPGWRKGSSATVDRRWHLRHDPTLVDSRSRLADAENCRERGLADVVWKKQQTRSNGGCPRGLKWRWYDATRGLGGRRVASIYPRGC